MAELLVYNCINSPTLCIVVVHWMLDSPSGGRCVNIRAFQFIERFIDELQVSC